MQTGTEGNSALFGVHLDIAKCFIVVGGDDDVHGFNCARERLVEIFFGDLKLKKRAVDLVDDDDRLDTFSQSLA